MLSGDIPSCCWRARIAVSFMRVRASGEFSALLMISRRWMVEAYSSPISMSGALFPIGNFNFLSSRFPYPNSGETTAS